MNPAQKAAVAIFAVVIMSFYMANVEASPRIRSMRVSNIKYYEIVCIPKSILIYATNH